MLSAPLTAIAFEIGCHQDVAANYGKASAPAGRDQPVVLITSTLVFATHDLVHRGLRV